MSVQVLTNFCLPVVNTQIQPYRLWVRVRVSRVGGQHTPPQLTPCDAAFGLISTVNVSVVVMNSCPVKTPQRTTVSTKHINQSPTNRQSYCLFVCLF